MDVETIVRVLCTIGIVYIVIKLSLGRTISDLYRYHYNDKDSRSSSSVDNGSDDDTSDGPSPRIVEFKTAVNNNGRKKSKRSNGYRNRYPPA